MKVGKNKHGFTIVELLIVIVVIAILAAITIVSYNGIQTSAREAAISAELNDNGKKVMSAISLGASDYLPSSVMANGLSTTKFNTNNYKVITYCASTSDFLIAVETTRGDKYFKRGGNKMVKDNSIDAFLPCPSQGISGAQTTYLNLPSQCSAENGTCAVSGTGTVVYGSAAQGRFNRLANQSGSVACSNATFTDPASGFAKACYVYPN